MTFIPAVVAIEDENGDRVDAPRADGSQAPIVLRLSGDLAGASTEYGSRTRVTLGVSGLQGSPVSSTAPTVVGQGLAWTGTEWAPGGLVEASVASFGAKGDGVTDDTAAITSAIAALANNGRLILPQTANFYKVSSLHITKPISIDGVGFVNIRSANTGGAAAVIVIDDGASGVLSGDVSISNVKVQYTGALNGDTISAIYSRVSGRAFFSRVEVTGAPFAGLYGVVGSGDIICDGVYAHGNGWGGISATSTNFAAYGGTRTEGNGQTYNTLDGYGITTHCTNVSIVGVVSGGNYTMQIDCHSPTRQLVIADCLIFFNGTENTSYAQGISLSDIAEQVTVTGNIIRGTGSNTCQYGIAITGEIQSVNPTNDMIFQGNEIADIGTCTAAIGIVAVDTKAVHVLDNVIRNVGGTYSIALFESALTHYTFGSRYIPRVVRCERNTIIDSMVVLLQIGAEIFFDRNTWCWGKPSGMPATPYIIRAYKDHIGRVHIGRNEAVGYGTSKQSPALTAAPSEWSWAAGDSRQNDAPAAAGFARWVCTTPGTAAAVTATTGTTSVDATSNHKLIYKIADASNVIEGDYLTLAGEFGGGAVEVVKVQNWMTNGTTTSGSAIIKDIGDITDYGSGATISFLAVNDYIHLQGVTFNGGDQFVKITAVNPGTTALTNTITVEHTADSSVSHAPIALNRCWVRYAGATVGVSGAAIAWQTAVFDTLQLGVANSTTFVSSGGNAFVETSGFLGLRLGSDSPNTDTLEFIKSGSNAEILTNTADNLIIGAQGSAKYILVEAGNGGASNGTIYLEAGAIEITKSGAEGNAALAKLDANGFRMGATTDTTTIHMINGGVQTTVGAAGAASAPPASPQTYLKLKINGTTYAIPCYLAS